METTFSTKFFKMIPLSRTIRLISRRLWYSSAQKKPQTTKCNSQKK